VPSTGNNAMPGIYIAVASFVSLGAVLVLRESARRPLPGASGVAVQPAVA
jgi:MFS transporter, MHS family, proline/betaine transporter